MSTTNDHSQHPHEPRIRTLEHRVENVEAKLDSGFSAVFGKLDAMNSTMSMVQARQPVGWDKVISTVQSLAVLFAMICAGIIYVASGITNKDTAALREDLAVIKFQLSQRAVPPTAWPASVEPATSVPARR